MENLFNQSKGEMPDPYSEAVPAYLVGADSHNIGNQGSSWFDPSTWGNRAGNALKFGAVSMLSGAAQLYNSGESVGNFLGLGDGTTTKIQDIVSGFDDDLGQYYSKNRDSADLVGFIASSLIPGMAGVKVLNAGQHALQGSRIGVSMGRLTGILAPQTETFIAGAAQDINAAHATFSAISQNGIKALASGAWQQALEGVAFETAVQASMYKSPILENQTAGDIATNLMMGGVLGGVVGGALEAASTLTQIRKKVLGYEFSKKVETARATQQELNRADINIIRNVQDIESTVQATAPGVGATQDEINLYNKSKTDIAYKLERQLNDVRESVNSLAKGKDLNVTNMVADAIRGESSQTVMESMLHVDEIVRPGVMTKVEEEANKLAKNGKPVDPEHQVNYVKLTGENAGRVQNGEPLIQSIADSVGLSKNGALMDAVLSKVKDFKFQVGKLWDASAKTGTTAHTEAEARYLWASRLKKLPDDLSVHMNDLPVLERAYDLGKLDIKLADNTGQTIKDGFATPDELWKHIVSMKEAVANNLMLKHAFGGEDYKTTSEAIAKIVNTKVGRLDGSLIGDELSDYRAWQSANSDYEAFRKSKNLPSGESTDARFRPTYAKVARRVPDMSDANGFVVDGATWIKTQEKLAQDAVNNVIAKNTGELYSNIPTIAEAQAWLANRYGAGSKMAAFASGAYGSFESVVQGYGAITNKLKTALRQTTSDTLQGPLAALGRNEEASIEFSTINQKVTRSAKQWVRYTDEEGGKHLVTKDAMAKLNDKKAPVEFGELGEGDTILLVNAETHKAIDAMIARSSARQTTYGELRAAQGKTDAKDPAVFRPIRANPKDYPFFAFVKDDKVTGQGHTTMIFADSESKLQQQSTIAEQAGFTVRFKQQTEEFKKAYGDYEYSRTLNESYIDSELKNRGIYSEHFTKTDPQKIVNDIVQQHLREDDVMAMELMRAKNQKIFDFLEDQGKAYSRVESSKFGGSSAAAESAGKNPYLSYIKTALDISKAPETMLYGINKWLDESVSRAVGAAKDIFNASKSPADIGAIQDTLAKYGMKNSYHDAALDLLVNHVAPKGELTKFVRSANSIMSTMTLGLDPLNGLVNAIGANVLRGTELTQIIRAIQDGNTELAGKLGDLAKIDVTGKGDLVLSPLKLYKKAQDNFFRDAREAQPGKLGDLMQRYTDAGYVTGDSAKFHNMMDDFTLKGTETVQDINSRLMRGYQTAKELSELGKKLTGNKFAEDYNRFISADVMRQLTDLGEDAGLMTREESHSYINTFVNRVDGVTVASQRPLMFQGPLGNAIGLFQSYQFNMMQNLFRYVGEGSKKDTAMLLGLQGTFFGLNGLPGFQFINQHIIGTASGNQNHVDLYDATYGAAGKQMGDLLMYGLPSDLLRTNLYSRGDINPRSVTIVPTQLKDIPFVSGFMNLMGNVKETIGKMAGGADIWSSFLQGVEHNGISRPLAGMAQVLEATGPAGQVYSTTSKGSILFSNDFASLASFSRLSGGRPIDEAIVNDGIYRIHSYQQWDRDRMNKLSEIVKTSSIEGRIPNDQQIATFASSYAAAGGKQPMFGKWMLDQMKNANLNEAQKITRQLQNPFAQKVQVLMGGDPYAN